MLVVSQWLLHDPQSNPLAYHQHPDSRSRNSPRLLDAEQVLLTDSRRCRLWVVETASTIREQHRI